ncbi:MAG: hypothetical protein M3Q52_04480 [Pseudomonadota bacterium]|nr:hypothetical protein [Pseudomonadota bacterium]
MIRIASALAAVTLAASPLPAAPPQKAPVLKPGAAKCQVNDDKALPCAIRKSEDGGLDIETGGEEPLLALVADQDLSLFALIGEAKDRTPLIMGYSVDPKDPACWKSADDDAVVRRLCVR